MKVKFKPEILETIRYTAEKLNDFTRMFLITYDNSNVYYSGEFDVPFIEVVDNKMYGLYYRIKSPANLAGYSIYKKHVMPYYNFTIDNEEIF